MQPKWNSESRWKSRYCPSGHCMEMDKLTSATTVRTSRSVWTELDATASSWTGMAMVEWMGGDPFRIPVACTVDKASAVRAMEFACRQGKQDPRPALGSNGQCSV